MENVSPYITKLARNPTHEKLDKLRELYIEKYIDIKSQQYTEIQTVYKIFEFLKEHI